MKGQGLFEVIHLVFRSQSEGPRIGVGGVQRCPPGGLRTKVPTKTRRSSSRNRKEPILPISKRLNGSGPDTSPATSSVLAAPSERLGSVQQLQPCRQKWMRQHVSGGPTGAARRLPEAGTRTETRGCLMLAPSSPHYPSTAPAHDINFPVLVESYGCLRSSVSQSHPPGQNTRIEVHALFALLQALLVRTGFT